MCSIDIEPCNQAHRHLRQALRDAEMAVMDEIEGEDEDEDFTGRKRTPWSDDD